MESKRRSRKKHISQSSHTLPSLRTLVCFNYVSSTDRCDRVFSWIIIHIILNSVVAENNLQLLVCEVCMTEGAGPAGAGARTDDDITFCLTQWQFNSQINDLSLSLASPSRIYCENERSYRSLSQYLRKGEDSDKIMMLLHIVLTTVGLKILIASLDF